MHKNYLKSILLPAVLTLFASKSTAQMAIEANGGLREYLGDMGSSLFFSQKPIYFAGGLNFTYSLGSSLDLVGSVSNGDVGFCRSFDSFVKEKDIVWKSFRANTTDLGIGVRYKLNNGSILPEDAKFQPWVQGSIAGFYTNSTIKWGPNQYVAATRIDQWGGVHYVQNTIIDMGAALMGGLGFRFVLADNVALTWSYIATYTFNDRWDGSNDPDPMPSYDKPLVNKLYRTNDMWGYHNVGIAFALGDGFSESGGGRRAPKDKDQDGVPDKYDHCKNTELKYRKYVDSLGCPADTDGDGILDADDNCPEVKGAKEFNGCPDTDGDGIEDKLDACPKVAGKAEMNGCPDTDGDGVSDKDDVCPTVAGPKELKGCPDSDGDGTPDNKDKCPNVAGPAAGEGCPDTDGDGVFNNVDACPDKAGSAASKGCPEIKEEVVKKIKGYAKGINFETNKAVILATSNKNLDELVKILKEYPDANVEVQGHTDNVGDAVANKTLSQDRADAVKVYLISKGVNAAKLKSIGYGSEMPIADNATPKGRENNRRVDFILGY